MGKFRSDLPGEQIHAVTRWGNMGIQTLFSGSGDRLWTRQPDYVGQGSCPVWWGDSETQLLWVNTSEHANALYDGCGHKVKDLDAIRELRRGRMAGEVRSSVERLGEDPRDLLCVTVDDTMHVFAPEA